MCVEYVGTWLIRVTLSVLNYTAQYEYRRILNSLHLIACGYVRQAVEIISGTHTHKTTHTHIHTTHTHTHIYTQHPPDTLTHTHTHTTQTNTHTHIHTHTHTNF
jgi:hypothetical protein